MNINIFFILFAFLLVISGSLAKNNNNNNIHPMPVLPPPNAQNVECGDDDD
uniref:Uncharacterized protein n=2 Tax=Meloidogyne TaxID=189290 RepID=A0A6V7Y2M7_MELEN|nr:unnamed protein product [Meloidogyne enterolobii]